ncbi:alpha/beta fold hydrolase [Microbispora sp. H11081]|uniref:alpha/beta fold hydrolase n=1 Tax=Microbispora sp. H11081 TaxID=2729107 RepID=UPI001473FD9E|nr:alpha/beta hydrolase [Microbispora sp. H11081]
MRVHASGEGPAVLWIHGYTMDSSTWRDLWALLPGRRHIGVDLPGHGGSGPMPPGTTLPGLAAELAAVARAEGAHDVVALSFGSLAGIQLAIDAPDVVRRLVVGAPTIAGAPGEAGTAPRYRALMALRRAGADGATLADVWMSSPPDIFLGTQAHPRLRASLRSVIARHGWDELRTGAMAAFHRHTHTDEALGAIRADTLVLVGDAEMPTFEANAERLGAVVPRCRVARMADAGHLCMIERPEAAARLIRPHLGRSADGAEA